MIEGVSKVVIEVADQDEALEFWTEKVGRETGSRSVPARRPHSEPSREGDADETFHAHARLR